LLLRAYGLAAGSRLFAGPLAPALSAAIIRSISSFSLS
jgi:hypothetical protein